MMHFVDVETTGLRPWEGQEIIEIAIITEHGDGRVDRYCTKIKPVRLEFAEAKALEVNGYTDALWADAPYMSEVIGDIYNLLRRGIIVGHNVAFDCLFIDFELERYGFSKCSYAKVDTMTLAHEHLLPVGLRSIGLKAIRKYMGWSCEGAHTAMVDAEDCRRMYHSLIRRSCYPVNYALLDKTNGIIH